MRQLLYSNPVVLQAAIPEHPKALRVQLPEPPNGDQEDQAFIYRIEGALTGFFNRCGHVRVPLDLDDGNFFDLEGMIICRVHGARFDEKQGHCLMGPAYTGLHRLIIEETESAVQVLGWEGPLPARNY